MYVATKNGANKGFCDRNDFCGVVLKSTDGGEIWEEIMDGLDDTDEFYSIVIHPEDHDIVFLSTSNGVYGSEDAGVTWQEMNNGLPTLKNQMRGNVGQTMKLSRDENYLILGITHYGVWRTDISMLGM